MLPAKSVLAQLEFVGEVEAKKQTYYVYRGAAHYVLASASSNPEKASWNFNVVSREAVTYLAGLLAGEQLLKTNDILQRVKKPALIKTQFDVLNAMYALCALGDAKMDARKKKDKATYFNVSSSARAAAV